MKSAKWIVLCCCLVQPVFGQSIRGLLESHGFKGGVIVHLGCGDGEHTAELLINDRCLVHGLDTDPGNVEKARVNIRSQGVYGRVSVMELSGRILPYADNLINLIVAEDQGGISTDELMRVLVPNGVALIRQGQEWRKTVKPRPAEIDEWRQYLHDADNNAVAHDSVVGPPRHLQWVDEPGWSRSHMGIPTVVSMVSSAGRLFTIEDRATPENPFLPGRWSLIARDAFNGIVLWRHNFPDFEPATRYIKDMAVQLQRRLAAIGDTVYCTPGLNAPVTAFEAATGNIVKVYKGTELTQEFAYDHDVLYLVIGDRMNAARYNIVKDIPSKGTNLGGSDLKEPFGGSGFRRGYAPESPDKADPVCAIVAVLADSGKEIWRIEDIHSYTGCSLAIKGQYAVYQTAGGLFCVNPETGKKLWSIDKEIQGGDGTEANTVVLSDSTVYAQEGKSFYAYSLKDGSEKWTAPIANNYEKTADLYDRCYRNFITDRYYINSKTGGADFLDLASKKEFPNHWTRGTCGMGVLPCNGLLYVPPYSCQCSIGAMVKNFNAFYTEKGLESSEQPVKIERRGRLVKGPAYEELKTQNSKFKTQSAWPAYRHDGKRSGVTSSSVPAKLKPLWTAQVQTVASALVVADNKVFVSDVDAHTVYALNASAGETIWRYVAGSRVDSPPAYYKGLVLFGSRDGWVHCVRASDGALAWRFKDLPDKLIGA
ncbi:MAG: outer membrane protein assembly factor BamB family protein, partial [Planctomycetota bacterium]